jgi:hypothetical protein
LAKASGTYTAALGEEEKKTENETKALVAQATQMGRLKQAWDIFSADFAKSAKTNETTAQQMATSFQTAAQGMESAIQAAFAAMVSGSESAGKAVEKAVFSMIAKIAEQWGAYYLAQAIADLAPGPTFNPAGAAGMFAAGAALEALGGVLGGLGSASSSASSGSASTATVTPSTSTVAAGSGPSTPNVPRLFSGAIVTQPTYAMIGDRDGGGSQTEGVFPLNDPRARQALLDAFGMGGGGGVTHNYNIQGMISTTDLTRLTRVISRGANTGRVRMSVTNSNRVTRRT